MVTTLLAKLRTHEPQRLDGKLGGGRKEGRSVYTMPAAELSPLLLLCQPSRMSALVAAADCATGGGGATALTHIAA